jgi:hypothetical protein
VTVACQTADHAERPFANRCLRVRVESQRSGVLITVRTNTDVAQLSAERVIVVADVEAAVEAVRGFLVAFAETTRNDEIA